MSTRLLRPTERGQITIPKEARDKLKITPDSRFKVSVEGDKIIYQLVSPFDMIVKEFQKEAEARGYTKERLLLRTLIHSDHVLLLAKFIVSKVDRVLKRKFPSMIQDYENVLQSLDAEILPFQTKVKWSDVLR